MEKIFNNKVYHCFGTKRGNTVDVEEVANMICASGIRAIPINTHKIEEINDWKKLPIGYGNANWDALDKLIDLSQCEPIWNINLPLSAQEAIERTKKIVEIGGKRKIKLEVLDSEYRWVDNDEVVKAIERLKTDNLVIWPLIKPDLEVFKYLDDGRELIRIQGAAISSESGISKEFEDEIKKIIMVKKCHIMLDGGIGSLHDIEKAFSLGFEYVLVNSFLFTQNKMPSKVLEEICNNIY